MKPTKMMTKTKTRTKSGRNKIRQSKELDNTELIVLEDVDNGNEYYLAVIDTFAVNGREYAALSAYEPDDGTHRDPEFVIMRYARSGNGEQYYQSIRSKKELNLVFDVFFERYTASI